MLAAVLLSFLPVFCRAELVLRITVSTVCWRSEVITAMKKRAECSKVIMGSPLSEIPSFALCCHMGMGVQFSQASDIFSKKSRKYGLLLKMSQCFKHYTYIYGLNLCYGPQFLTLSLHYLAVSSHLTNIL